MELLDKKWLSKESKHKVEFTETREQMILNQGMLDKTSARVFDIKNTLESRKRHLDKERDELNMAIGAEWKKERMAEAMFKNAKRDLELHFAKIKEER